MAIYIHDAPFSLPPFPSDKCDRCLINGPIKVANARQDHGVGGEKNWGAASRGR